MTDNMIIKVSDYIAKHLPTKQKPCAIAYIRKLSDCGVRLTRRVPSLGNNITKHVLQFAGFYGVVPVTVEFYYFTQGGEAAAPVIYVHRAVGGGTLMKLDCDSITKPETVWCQVTVI